MGTARPSRVTRAVRVVRHDQPGGMRPSCAAIYGECTPLVKKYPVNFPLRSSRTQHMLRLGKYLSQSYSYSRCRCRSSLRGYLVSFPRSGFLREEVRVPRLFVKGWGFGSVPLETLWFVG
jgi:hypothetical protein